MHDGRIVEIEKDLRGSIVSVKADNIELTKMSYN